MNLKTATFYLCENPSLFKKKVSLHRILDFLEEYEETLKSEKVSKKRLLVDFNTWLEGRKK